MKYQIFKPWLIVVAVPLLSLAGCHVVLGPDDGYQEWWYYCDNTGCYRCNPHYCEISGDGECKDYGCPSGMYCDPYDNTCKTKSCRVSSDCGSYGICKEGQCYSRPDTCTKHTDCGDGGYCNNGQCKNTGSCKKDEDCDEYGSDMICDDRGTCIPGNPIKSCKTASACPSGLCIDGQCGSCSEDCGGGKTCEFDKHCGAGRKCLDGQCTTTCSNGKGCGSGQICRSNVCIPKTENTCVANTDCGSEYICVNGSCYPDCTSSGTCASSLDICNSEIMVGEKGTKICKADHTSKPQCQFNKDCNGELCVNGICRTSCTKNEDCAACDDGPVCAKGGFCMTSVEADPQCAKNSDCGSGKFCLGAQCVTL